jgi:hypothetical protein
LTPHGVAANMPAGFGGACLAEEMQKRAVTASIVAWLVPGGGHLYLGKRGRGLVFMAAISVLFVWGIGMRARLTMPSGFDDPLAVVFGLAQMAAGVLYFGARVLSQSALLSALGFSFGVEGVVTAPSYEYGNTFTTAAGLLNILVMIDAFDIALGRKK